LIFSGADEEEEEEDEEESDEDIDDADFDEEDEDAEEEDEDLLQIVKQAKKRKDLKDLVEEHDVFEPLRRKMRTLTSAEALKNAMLKLLTTAPKETAPEKPKASAPAAKATAPKAGKKGVTSANVNGKSYAEIIDERAVQGGTWDELVTDINAITEPSGKTYTAGAIRGHVKYRVSKNPKFLGKRKITEAGIA